MRIACRAGHIVVGLATCLLAAGLCAPLAAASALPPFLAMAGDNPVPYIFTLSPAAASTGGADFTLEVSGGGFVPGSQVQWDGVPKPTTYGSATQLSALVTAADVAVSKTVSITVVNPSPGGGASTPVAYVVAAPNPVPDVTGLSPAQAIVGSGPLSITVIGSGFAPGATVLWNGEDRTTGYLNESMLAATVRAGDLAAAGTAYVSVLNPAPGGGQSSSARVFTILNPTPIVALLVPASAWAGGVGLTIAVEGSDFAPSSVVQVAGIDRTTTFVSTSRLEAPVVAADVARPGPLSVRVFTPTPGGGLSAPRFLAVNEDNIPPVTRASGLKTTWNRAPVVLTLVATDVGLGVETTFFRLGEAGEYIIGTSVGVPAPQNHSNDGLHTVQFFSIDKVLNWEQPVKSVSVGIDTWPPTTTTASAQAKRGSNLQVRYRIVDPSCARVRDARLTVRDATGKLVLARDLGRPLTRIWRASPAFPVKIPRGTYKMSVLAHDLAGAAQSGTRSGMLTVY